eukprot:SAG11_NODE_1292_length_5285_cov_9.364057_3_plen_68_part_00
MVLLDTFRSIHSLKEFHSFTLDPIKLDLVTQLFSGDTYGQMIDCASATNVVQLRQLRPVLTAHTFII